MAGSSAARNRSFSSFFLVAKVFKGGEWGSSSFFDFHGHNAIALTNGVHHVQIIRFAKNRMDPIQVCLG
jgi:hypothetical protein